MKILSKKINKDFIIDLYPVFAATLFEIATGGHIVRMIRERSALGQEPISWLLVSLGLFGWYKWYTIRTPNQKFAQWTALVSSLVNLVAFFISCYYKWWM
jgi:hypothetical protein